MELQITHNIDNRGKLIRAGLGLSLLGMAMFPPEALKTSKWVTLLASLGAISLAEAALGYCAGTDLVSQLKHDQPEEDYLT
jgi:hypothetical protein